MANLRTSEGSEGDVLATHNLSSCRGHDTTQRLKNAKRAVTEMELRFSSAELLNFPEDKIL